LKFFAITLFDWKGTRGLGLVRRRSPTADFDLDRGRPSREPALPTQRPGRITGPRIASRNCLARAYSVGSGRLTMLTIDSLVWAPPRWR
jgi:hypothetical protein